MSDSTHLANERGQMLAAVIVFVCVCVYVTVYIQPESRASKQIYALNTRNADIHFLFSPLCTFYAMEEKSKWKTDGAPHHSRLTFDTMKLANVGLLFSFVCTNILYMVFVWVGDVSHMVTHPLFESVQRIWRTSHFRTLTHQIDWLNGPHQLPQRYDAVAAVEGFLWVLCRMCVSTQHTHVSESRRRFI